MTCDIQRNKRIKSKAKQGMIQWYLILGMANDCLGSTCNREAVQMVR